EAGDGHAFEELVGVLMEDVAVFECARLGFVGVADEINRFGVSRGNKAPFYSAGESRPAASAQAGLLDRVDDFLARELESLFPLLVAALAEISRNRGVPAFAVN